MTAKTAITRAPGLAGDRGHGRMQAVADVAAARAQRVIVETGGAEQREHADA